MKFLCDNCQAKYQISDDRVAGKVVRMKCRRCEHIIEVKPQPAEGAPPAPISSSGPRSLREPDLDDDSGDPTEIMSPSSLRLPVPAPAPSAPRLSAPSARPSSPVLRAVPGGPARVPPPPVRSGPGASRLTPLGQAATATKLTAPREAPAASAFRSADRSVPAPTSVPAPSPSSPLPLTRAKSSEDWFVGLAGAPLGPVRSSVIREKAASGLVTGDSLVWREGFEAWVPLKNFPELLELLPGGARHLATSPPSQRGSLPPKAPPAALPPLPVNEPEAEAARPDVDFAAALMGTVMGSKPPSPVAAEEAASLPSAEPAPAPTAPATEPATTASLGVMADPFAAPPAPAAPPEPAAPVAAPTPPPAAVASAAPAVAPGATLDASELAFVRPRPGMHPMAYAFIAMAGLFGAVAAYMLFLKDPAPVEPKVVYVQVTAAPVAGAVPTAEADTAADPAEPPGADPSPEAASVKTGALPSKPGGAGVATAAPAVTAAPAASANIDTSGFGGPVQGPASTPAGNGAGAGSSQLTTSQLQSVVGANQATIRRRCWQPALQARAGDATSARVNAHIVVAPSGSVQSVRASGGEKDFPGLSSCIQSRIQGWKFPPSGGSTTVDVPFSFVGQ